MNAYLYSAWISQYLQGHFSDGCSSLIVYGADEKAARLFFENCVLSRNNAEPAGATKIERIVGAPFLDQLLTESGSAPIDWERACAEAEQDLETVELDDFEHGYWVDCNQCVAADNLALSLEALRSGLPEEIRSGLNWSPEKTRLFILSVLSPPAPAREFVDEYEEEELRSGGKPGEGADDSREGELAGQQAPFPEVVEKELAVLLRARNSVVAAWLWRKYAANTSLKHNALRIDAWCGAAACPV